MAAMFMSLGLSERLFLLYIPELNLLSQSNLVRAELFFTPVVYIAKPSLWLFYAHMKITFATASTQIVNNGFGHSSDGI